MPIVKCAWTGVDMLIDEPGGVEYITHADGSITCNSANREAALENMPTPTEEPPTEEGE
jgi:hypothetical protein